MKIPIEILELNNNIIIDKNSKSEIVKKLESINDNFDKKDYDSVGNKCESLYEFILEEWCKKVYPELYKNDNNPEINIKNTIEELIEKIFKEKDIDDFNNLFTKIKKIRRCLKNKIIFTKDHDNIKKGKNKINKLDEKTKKMYVRFYIDYCKSLFNLLLLKQEIDLATADIRIDKFPAGGKGKNLINKLYEKLATLAEIDKKTIAKDKKLIITINDKSVDEFKNMNLTIQTCTVIIKANPGDQYFINRKKIDIKIRIYLEKEKITINQFPAGGKGKILFNKVYKKLANLKKINQTTITEDDIKNDENLTIIINNKYLDKFVNNILTIKEYEIKIKANDKDKYFKGEAITSVKLTPIPIIDLKTINIKIDKYYNPDIPYRIIAIKVFKQLEEPSGFQKEYLLIYHSDDLKNDFFKLIDASGKILKDGDRLTTAQTYTIKLTALADDQYFKNKKIITFNIKNDLLIFRTMLEFDGTGKTGKDLKNAVYKKLEQHYNVNQKDIAKDKNLKITIKKSENDIKPNNILTAGNHKIIIIANENDKYFMNQKIAINRVTFNLEKEKITINQFPAGGKGQILFNKVCKKLADLAGDGITQDIIAADPNLTITINDKTIDEFKNNNLEAKEYIIKIKVIGYDQYFTGKSKDIKVTLIKTKIDLLKVDLTILPFAAAANKNKFLINKIYEKLADFAGTNKKRIANDKNLKIKINDIDVNELKNNNLESKEYKITITANKNDQYFKNKTTSKVMLMEKIDLATANIKIDDIYKPGTKCSYIADHIFLQLKKLSGLSLNKIWKYSKNLENDFFKLTNEKGQQLKKEYYDSLEYSHQLYTIKLKAPKNDKYFTGIKTFTFIVVDLYD